MKKFSKIIMVSLLGILGMNLSAQGFGGGQMDPALEKAVQDSLGKNPFRIIALDAKGPFAKSGLGEKDILVAVNGKALSEDPVKDLAAFKVGEKITLSYIHDMRSSLEFGFAPEVQKLEITLGNKSGKAYLGLSLAPMKFFQGPPPMGGDMKGKGREGDRGNKDRGPSPAGKGGPDQGPKFVL